MSLRGAFAMLGCGSSLAVTAAPEFQKEKAMKLSEAMMLGAGITEFHPYHIDCCALGAAANAVGIPKCRVGDRWHEIEARWPWLRNAVRQGEQRTSTNDYWNHIAHTFNAKVSRGCMTFEQLVDYVRSVEPECGECNRFECTCVKAATPEEEKVTA